MVHVELLHAKLDCLDWIRRVHWKVTIFVDLDQCRQNIKLIIFCFGAIKIHQRFNTGKCSRVILLGMNWPNMMFIHGQTPSASI
ncbi:hypothetical protein ATO5_15810 [Loktanella sp. 22II-4b]|nr:hypothetical protein ATO5_15810 [Loktanella sp. 22II-4b]